MRKRIIDYRYGDLFRHPFSEQRTYIAHVCNSKGAWGSGFVIPLSKHFPKAKERYLAWSKGKLKHPIVFEMGRTQFVHENNVTICNMVAQTLGGSRPLRYNKLVQCMEFVAQHISKDARIVAPLFGSDLAGGNWNFIADLIDDIWLKMDIPVTVYWMPNRYPAEFKPPELPPRFLVRSDDSVVWEYEGDWGVYDIKDKPLTSDGQKSLPNEHHTYEALINTNKDGITFFPIQEYQVEEYNTKRDEWYKQLSKDTGTHE